MARASPARFLIPPDTSPGSFVRWSIRPTSSAFRAPAPGSPARSCGCARGRGRRCCRRGSSNRTARRPGRGRRTSCGSVEALLAHADDRLSVDPDLPPSGRSSPMMFLSSTDFPVPDGPSMAVILPFGTSKVMSSSTVWVPNVLVTPRREMMGSPGAIQPCPAVSGVWSIEGEPIAGSRLAPASRDSELSSAPEEAADGLGCPAHDALDWRRRRRRRGGGGGGEEEPEPEELEAVVGRTLPSPTDCVIPLTELVTFPRVLLSPLTLPVAPLTVCATPP